MRLIVLRCVPMLSVTPLRASVRLMGCVTLQDGSEAIEALAAAAEGSDEFTEVQAILSARVPILKLLHTATNVQCDVTVNRPISVHNSCLLKVRPPRVSFFLTSSSSSSLSFCFVVVPSRVWPS